MDLGNYSDVATDKIEGFNDIILKCLPGLSEHRCSIGRPGGFVQRLKEGTYLAHVIEHCAIEILNLLDQDISFGRARNIDQSEYMIIYGYRDETIGIESGKLAVKLVHTIINGGTLDLTSELKHITHKACLNSLGPSTLSIFRAAMLRGIPVRRIGDRSILQLGYGKYSKRVEATITDDTSCVAVDIACDKMLTKDILYDAGIPVPRGRVCKDINYAVAIAKDIGLPVVVKPQMGNQGKGVSTDINNENELEEAFKLAKKFDNNIIIERFIRGKDYRILVVGNKVIAVSQRLPAYVMGNGKHTVGELIDIVNSDPLRGEHHEKPLTKIKIDPITEKMLAKQGLFLNSIPKLGKRIILKPGSNLSTGGIAIDSTDIIHPINEEIAIRAVSAIGLDIAGVDITCEDIARPITPDTGGVIEINAAPGLRMHLYPSEGRPRDVGGAIVDMLYPKDKPHSIPIISVTGTNGKTTTVRMISHILRIHGYKVGMTTTDGIYIYDRLIVRGDTTGPISAQTLLSERDIDVAVLETARGGIIRSGLGYDLSDVGVLTNISKDHLGQDNIHTLDDMLHVKSLVVEAVKDEGFVVINADDKMVLKSMDKIRSNIILFSAQPNNNEIERHIKYGGMAIFIKDQLINIANKGKLLKHIHASQIPATFGGKLLYNLENMLAAISVAYALKIPIKTIERAVYSFYNDSIQNPGRFNIFNMGNFRIILDYGHNIEGYLNVLKSVQKLDASRLIGVIGVPGDRDDINIREIGKIAGEAFDYLIVKEDGDTRGRERGEVADLLIEGISKSKGSSGHIETIYDEVKAVEHAIGHARAGDLIVVFYEKLEPILSVVEGYKDLNLQPSKDKFKLKLVKDRL